MTNKLLQLSHSLHEKYISWVSKTQVKTLLSNLLTRLCWNEFCVTIFINREVHHLPSILPQRLDNSGEPVTSTWLLEAILGATITPHSAKTPHWAWPAENRHIEKRGERKRDCYNMLEFRTTGTILTAHWSICFTRARPVHFQASRCCCCKSGWGSKSEQIWQKDFV